MTRCVVHTRGRGARDGGADTPHLLQPSVRKQHNTGFKHKARRAAALALLLCASMARTAQQC